MMWTIQTIVNHIDCCEWNISYIKVQHKKQNLVADGKFQTEENWTGG